jgi:hypothetical protein
MQARTNGLLFEAAALLDGTRGVVRLHSNRLEWISDGAAAASVQLEVAHVASFQLALFTFLELLRREQ